MMIKYLNRSSKGESINDKVVEIIANRIVKGSMNPKTHSPFLLEDIVDDNYKKAVEDYIILNSGAI